MNKEISFFDLDGTLWNLNNDVYLIDKEKPNKHLMKISRIEFSLIKNGFYQKDGVKISYNGQTYYISNEMFEIACTKAKTENGERFGISFINLKNDDSLQTQNLQILLHNILHISKNVTDVGLLTARFDQRNHADLLNKLRLELKNINVEINKIYFISDNIYSKTPLNQSLGKLNILLEHLIGLKIKNGTFTDEIQDKYDIVNFYDDDIKNIDTANSIIFYLSGMLYNASDDIHKIVLERIRNNKLYLNTYMITHNQMNPFKHKKIQIVEPARYPIYSEVKTLENIKVLKLKDFLFD